MYHNDVQVFQRLHSFSQTAQEQGKKEGIMGMAPDIGGAMEREKRAVEGNTAGEMASRTEASDRGVKEAAEQVAKRVP